MADKDHLILTAIGPDQVGLVQRIAAFISRHDCNIEDSKMAVFCGEFAVILLINRAGVNLVKVRREYRDIVTETRLAISIQTPSTSKTPRALLPYRINTSWLAHPRHGY